jgi:hypothetical protein
MGIYSVSDAVGKSKEKLTKYLTGVEGAEQLEVIEEVRSFLTGWKAGLNKQEIKPGKSEETTAAAGDSGDA